MELKTFGMRPVADMHFADFIGVCMDEIFNQMAKITVWQAAYLPFGRTQVQLGTVQNNLRFPGQYYDAETGLHYNWNATTIWNPEVISYLTPLALKGNSISMPM